MNSSTAVELSGPTGADLLAVVADPVRWRLLAALSHGSLCVCQLQPAAGVSAPALSHHLRVLREAGLIAAARRGRWIDYKLCPDAVGRLRDALPFAQGTAPTSAGGCGTEARGG